MWKNTVERGRSQMAIWRIRRACWITKATSIYTVCVILIVFPLQQCLHEGPSQCCAVGTLPVLLSMRQINLHHDSVQEEHLQVMHIS
jgi:hypothetical protein